MCPSGNQTRSEEAAVCPNCKKEIRPAINPAAAPENAGLGIAAVTWVCPECGVILGVSEVDFFTSR